MLHLVTIIFLAINSIKAYSTNGKWSKI